MNTDQKNMFLAVGLSAAVLFIWQAYFAPKIAPQGNQSSVSISTPALDSGKTSIDNLAPSKGAAPAPTPTTAPVVPNKNLVSKTLSLGDYKVVMKSDLSIVDMDAKGTVFPFTEVVGSELPFKIQAITKNGLKDLLFNFNQSSPTSLKGVDTALGVKLEAKLSPETGRFSIKLNSSKPLRYRVAFNSTPEQLDNNQVRDFVYYGQEVERVTVGDDETKDATVRWVGLDFNFHLFALIFEEKSRSKIRITEAGQYVIDSIDPKNVFNADVIFAKKNYDTLTNMGDNLHLSVDFGIFGILAVPILRGLQFLYDFIPNYGVAIILLTLVMRMVTFPLQYKSFKSMKKMQVVQPELQKLKEKFKDDPQRMQKETMELFKRAGANPLGGCLPMLLQMPIFFAFYQVLYNAVELVQAPFAFWITDLSIKDPYYVLPVLMGIAMFGQSKLNPSTSADPTQQKVMMFMPLIFCFIMKDLPAGLNLYIFVSTTFGIVQQLFVYKQTD